MFHTEIRVEGKYVSGTIKKEKDTYMLFTSLNIGGNKTHTWPDYQLAEIADELRMISDKVDSLNNPTLQNLRQ